MQYVFATPEPAKTLEAVFRCTDVRLRNDLNKHFRCRFRLRFQPDVAGCRMIMPIPWSNTMSTLQEQYALGRSPQEYARLGAPL